MYVYIMYIYICISTPIGMCIRVDVCVYKYLWCIYIHPKGMSW